MSKSINLALAQALIGNAHRPKQRGHWLQALGDLAQAGLGYHMLNEHEQGETAKTTAMQDALGKALRGENWRGHVPAMGLDQASKLAMLAKALSPEAKFQTMTPEQVQQAGYAPGSVVQVGPRGGHHLRQRPQQVRWGRPFAARGAKGKEVFVQMDQFGNKRVVDGYKPVRRRQATPRPPADVQSYNFFRNLSPEDQQVFKSLLRGQKPQALVKPQSGQPVTSTVPPAPKPPNRPNSALKGFTSSTGTTLSPQLRSQADAGGFGQTDEEITAFFQKLQQSDPGQFAALVEYMNGQK